MIQGLSPGVKPVFLPSSTTTPRKYAQNRADVPALRFGARKGEEDRQKPTRWERFKEKSREILSDLGEALSDWASSTNSSHGDSGADGGSSFDGGCDGGD